MLYACFFPSDNETCHLKRYMYLWIVVMFGTDAAGKFFLEVQCLNQLHYHSPPMQMYFAEVLQINTLYSTENISFSPTQVCACTNAWQSFSHTCMHVHTPNKKHFFHTHACTCAYAHTHLLCPATCFHYWSPSWLAPNIDR
jgi:hypothetical protein